MIMTDLITDYMLVVIAVLATLVAGAALMGFVWISRCFYDAWKDSFGSRGKGNKL